MNELDPFYFKLRDFYKQQYRDEWREEFNKIKPHYEMIKKFYEWATSSHYL